jgi:hypothetical protein
MYSIQNARCGVSLIVGGHDPGKLETKEATTKPKGEPCNSLTLMVRGSKHDHPHSWFRRKFVERTIRTKPVESSIALKAPEFPGK